MSNINSNNEIKINGDNNKIYIGSKEKFEPMIDWLKKEIVLKTKGVGKRYSPQLNVEIENLRNYINSLSSIKKIINEIEPIIIEFQTNKIVKNYYKSFKLDLKELDNLMSELSKNSKLVIYNEIYQKIYNFKNLLENERENVLNAHQDEAGLNPYNTDKKMLKDTFYNLNRTINIINDELLYLEKLQINIKIFEIKTILLTGEALIGKTHLFCDIALNRIKNNQPTLLFFGNEFSSDKTIISNIISNLGVSNCDEDEFLEALDKLGQDYNTKTIIMIDAINETRDNFLWRDEIIKFCEKIKSYPNLALALSIRDVEKNKLISNDNRDYILNEIVEVEHKGFEGIEVEALQTFCSGLKVEFPKVPIHTYRLFVNPGILYLYIEIIKDSTKKIDTNIINPTTIFKAYIENLNRKFYQKYQNDIDEDDEIIEEAINEFISLGTKQDYIHFYLNYKTVSRELKSLHHKVLEFLVSEGVFNKLKTKEETNLYFTYQKFENYFIAEYLLNDYENNRKIIFELIKGYNGAISEALFMQIPEKLDKEIFDLNIWLLRDRYICELYLNSLIWRNANKITETTFKYITFIINKYNLLNKYFDVVLQLSTIPNHPFNIFRLHSRLLLKFQLNERDFNWSIYIHNSYRYDEIVKRVINWAWEKDENFEINDESLYLYGLTLSWFLTSSNRFLRDGTTKALVNLFTNKVDIFLKVLMEFENVNDLYILERLYAVAYGIVLRSSDKNGFKELGSYIYSTIFNKDEVIEHIMIRDYAKNSIEVILNEFELNIDIEKIEPPYGSKIDNNIVDENIIHNEDYKMIYDSLIYDSQPKPTDFGHYILSNTLNEFDTTIEKKFAQRWIFKKVIESWKSELFKDFDEKMNINKWYRNANKPERIGKKYQWLAFYEFLAKIADNYELKTRFENENNKYKGTYQLNIRALTK